MGLEYKGELFEAKKGRRKTTRLKLEKKLIRSEITSKCVLNIQIDTFELHQVFGNFTPALEMHF